MNFTIIYTHDVRKMMHTLDYVALLVVSGTFCDKGQKCENGPNLPLGSLEVFVYGESSPKFTMYKKQRLVVL